MNKIQLLDLLKGYAKKYRTESQDSTKRNRHMNYLMDGENIPQHYIDAVLVDFINYIGTMNCVDYALYTKDINTD